MLFSLVRVIVECRYVLMRRRPLNYRSLTNAGTNYQLIEKKKIGPKSGAAMAALAASPLNSKPGQLIIASVCVPD